MIKVAMILIQNCNKLFLRAYELEYTGKMKLWDSSLSFFKKKKDSSKKSIREGKHTCASLLPRSIMDATSDAAFS